MAARLGVRAGVLARRGVAAADVAALGASAQMEPPAGALAREAVGTALTARRDGRIDSLGHR